MSRSRAPLALGISSASRQAGRSTTAVVLGLALFSAAALILLLLRAPTPPVGGTHDSTNRAPLAAVERSTEVAAVALPKRPNVAIDRGGSARTADRQPAPEEPSPSTAAQEDRADPLAPSAGETTFRARPDSRADSPPSDARFETRNPILRADAIGQPAYYGRDPMGSQNPQAAAGFGNSDPAASSAAAEDAAPPTSSPTARLGKTREQNQTETLRLWNMRRAVLGKPPIEERQ